MKTTIKGTLLLAMLLACSVSGQDTNLNFNNISATVEGAIRLSWNSTSNEVYRIDYASEIIDTNTGYTVWQPLYDNYPSHGTSTFWLDTGNYNLEPSIQHPKKTEQRYYRIVNKGTNDGEPPYIVITSPTNNSVLSDQITVSVVATSSMPVINIKLFVDGQEMDRSEDGTNFVINTCEWPNGPHVLFATAKAQSTFSGPSGYFPITIGRSVSPYMNVTFDNLISRVAFSQEFFEPSLGQTQQVTASFAANVDWTLQMINEDSNVVRTVTGSGISLAYNWDGTGSGGTNVPAGVYYYVISAQTNGQAYIPPQQTNDPPEDPPQLFAMALDGYSSAAPLFLYPPGMETNDMLVFESTYAEMAPERLSSAQFSVASSGSEGQYESQGASSAASQSTTAPTRPPTAPVNNVANTNAQGSPQTNNYAIGFYDFQNPVTKNNPRNGLQPISSQVHLNGCSSCSSWTYHPIPEANMNSVNMIQTMKKLGWKLAFQKFNELLPVQSMRRSDQSIGGGEIFTQATIGILMGHGDYGSDLDYSPGSGGGSYQTYVTSGCPSDGAGNSSWLRLCQFGFGGNLKWMAILACNSLPDPNWNSMLSHGAIPLKETHLLCGTTNIAALGENIAAYWGENMIKKKQSIKDAWFNAGKAQYKEAAPGALTNSIGFRVTGYPECIDDTVATNTPPSSPSPTPGGLTKRDSQVYP
jgi:hypothetical protein